MAEDTDHVLTTIDGALSDWATSGDAMRWTPEPETEPAPTGPGWSVGFLVDDMPPENGGDRGRVWQASTPAAVEAFAELAQRMRVNARALQAIGERLSRAAEQATQAANAATRQRALWLQQNRQPARTPPRSPAEDAGTGRR